MIEIMKPYKPNLEYINVKDFSYGLRILKYIADIENSILNIKPHRPYHKHAIGWYQSSLPAITGIRCIEENKIQHTTDATDIPRSREIAYLLAKNDIAHKILFYLNHVKQATIDMLSENITSNIKLLTAVILLREYNLIEYDDELILLSLLGKRVMHRFLKRIQQ